MSQQFRDEGLIVDDDVAHYDGTTAVVRSRHLGASEIEFLRWKAERWMKLRHLPATFLHSPMFVLRHGLEMMRFTFAGTTVRSIVGLDSDHAVFDRYRHARRGQRHAATITGAELAPDRLHGAHAH